MTTPTPLVTFLLCISFLNILFVDSTIRSSPIRDQINKNTVVKVKTLPDFYTIITTKKKKKKGAKQRKRKIKGVGATHISVYPTATYAHSRHIYKIDTFLYMHKLIFCSTPTQLYLSSIFLIHQKI